MLCDFKAGDQVVCIDDIFNPSVIWSKLTTPTKGTVYTVRDVFMHEYMDETCPAILVEEIINPPMLNADTNFFLQEMPFAAWRFKKLDKLEKKDEATKYNFNDLLKVTEQDAKHFEEELEEID